MDFAKQILEKIKLESLIPYLDNTVYLIAFLVILTLLIYFFLSHEFNLRLNLDYLHRHNCQ